MRRTRLEIKRQVLELARTKVKPTVLMQSANLSWKLMGKVCDELCEAGMLEFVPATENEIWRDARTNYFYRATPQGLAHIPRIAVALATD